MLTRCSWLRFFFLLPPPDSELSPLGRHYSKAFSAFMQEQLLSSRRLSSMTSSPSTYVCISVTASSLASRAVSRESLGRTDCYSLLGAAKLDAVIPIDAGLFGERTKYCGQLTPFFRRYHCPACLVRKSYACLLTFLAAPDFLYFRDETKRFLHAHIGEVDPLVASPMPSLPTLVTASTDTPPRGSIFGREETERLVCNS